VNFPATASSTGAKPIVGDEDTCSLMASSSSWLTPRVVLVTYHRSTRVTIDKITPSLTTASSRASGADPATSASRARTK